MIDIEDRTDKTTNLNDEDIILGPREKLKFLAETIGKESKDKELVILNCMCTPTITGDDMEAVIKISREKARCPILYLNPRARTNVVETGSAVFKEIFEKVKSSSHFSKIKPEPRTLNLIDFSTVYVKEELQPLLKEIGIKINCILLPEIDIQKFKQYHRASFQVLFEEAPHWETIQKYLIPLPIKTITVPVPYGKEGARNCFYMIASIFGKEKEARSLWENLEKKFFGVWKKLKAQAKKYRLAFVLDKELLSMIEKGDYVFAGRPLLRILNKMGFGIDLLIYSPDKGTRKEILDISQKLKINPCTIYQFSNPEQLQELLFKGPFCAVYSDVFSDWRLTEAGKAQFSLRYCDMGFQGAIRTLENLLGVCRLPFYQDYRKYFKSILRNRYE